MVDDTNVPPELPNGPILRLQEGMVIDGYVLKSKLHLGGMATLWDVVRQDGNTDAGVPLIMKTPRIKGGEDPATIVGFEVEQMVMPLLKGKHVPRFISKGDFVRQPYIVMEHIEGESLKPRLDAAPLPFDEVAHIGHHVAFALHELHKQHVVHLDIKPSNIIRRKDSDGEVVLVDFGLSRHDHLPDLLEEEFSLPMGTGPYISPEQVQFVRNDPRSDLFAMGVMLYHFTTGHRPFGQPTSVSGLRKRLYTEPEPPRALRRDTPPWLQEIILRCLEVDPDKRYQSAAQLASDLKNPSQVSLTPRASRLTSSGPLGTLRRWFKAMGSEPRQDTPGAQQIERSPIIMVAVGIRTGTPDLDAKLLATVGRIMQIEPGARLACVSIMKTNRIGMDTLTDEQGNSLHVQQLIAIKHWARPLQQSLKMAEHRLTFHVLEAPDTATAIIDFANKNQVDHIVVGARGNSALRRYLGSVSAQVVAEAECSVTVVRI
jgi:serine/threonine protein kinase